jgi:hypothetical protein
MTTTEKRCTCTGPLYPKEARVDRHIDPACPWHGQWAHLFNKQLPRYDDDAPLPDPPPPTREEAIIKRLRFALEFYANRDVWQENMRVHGTAWTGWEYARAVLKRPDNNI